MLEMQKSSIRATLSLSSRSRRQSSMQPLSSYVIVLTTLFLLVFATTTTLTVHAQQIGVDICACSPSTYNFRFDFAKTCATTNIGGVGIEFNDCSISTFGQDQTNLVPTQVTSVDVLEFDQNGNLLKQQSDFVTISNGGMYQYTSYSQNASQVTASTAPKSLEITALAVNNVGDTLFMLWTVVFSNSCSGYPVFRNGQSIGWTVFVSREIDVWAL